MDTRNGHTRRAKEIAEARLDLQTALELAAQQRKTNLKVLIEERFRQPERNRFNPQDKIWTVFNIGGNNFRLIASIQYNPTDRRVTINKILTHAEYDKGRWKE